MSLSSSIKHLFALQRPTEDSGSPVGTLMDRMEAVQSELNGWRARKSKRLEEHGALQAGTPAWAVWQSCWNTLQMVAGVAQMCSWSNMCIASNSTPAPCLAPASTAAMLLH